MVNDNFFSIAQGMNFDMCITHLLFGNRNFFHIFRCKADATIQTGPEQCKAEDRPELGIIELHLFSLFGAGITMSAWTWTSSTLSNWKTAWDR